MYYRTAPLSLLAAMRAVQFPPIMRALLIVCNAQTVKQMAQQLGKTPDEIRDPLRQLRAMQMIDTHEPYHCRPLAAWAGYDATHHYGSRLVGRQTRPLRSAA